MSLSISYELREIAKQRCRALRKLQTPAEKMFWNAVRNRRFMGLKFYRQYPIFVEIGCKQTFFISDFFCFEKKLAIEIDGKIHDFQIEKDTLRDEMIRMNGLDIIHFKNIDIENDLNSALKKLEQILK